MHKTLTGRLIFLTIIFTMIAEVLIFIPSVAGFRENFLMERLERAHIASLSILADPNGMVDADLRKELLRNTGAKNITVFRSDARELILSEYMPSNVDETYNVPNETMIKSIMDAFSVLTSGQDRLIRIIGMPTNSYGEVIEVTLAEQPLRKAMFEYGGRIFLLSLFLSFFIAICMLIVIRNMIGKPIDHIIFHIKKFQSAPEDRSQIIEPSAKVIDFYEAEVALADMQQQLNQALLARKNMVALGEGISKISHDLRNILTTAQLFADRFEESDDPSIKRVAPKLVNSISRAINLAERTLSYGQTEEPAPELAKFLIAELIDDVVEAEQLNLGDHPITFTVTCSKRLNIWADREQIFRVVSNITRNACQVLQARTQGGKIDITVKNKASTWSIVIKDDGPGLPEKARTNMFMPFKGSARAGGSGLGLAIAAELVAAHDGSLILLYSGDQGTAFEISLPKER